MCNSLQLRGHMQKLLQQMPIIYFAFLLFATTLTAVLSSNSYEFIITNRAIWFLLSLLIQILLASIWFIKRNELSKASIAFSQALPMLAFAYYFFCDSFIDMVPSGLIALHALLYFIPCYAISLLQMNSRFIRMICAVLNTILLLLFSLLFLLAITFGSMGEKNIVKQTTSPNELYVATVISADSGAVGGATTVIVEKTPTSINVGFGRFAKVQQVYSGRWDAYQRISIKWKDDHMLLINGNAYRMPD